MLLRRLACRAPSPGLARLGHVFAALVLPCLLFDLAENALLWAGTVTAAPVVSPWLAALVRLKLLSSLLTLAYAGIWAGARWRARVSAQSR